MYELESTRRDYEETGPGYLERHPKMLENTRQILEVKKALSLEVKNSIEDLRDKHNQLSAQESEFNTAMQKVQEDSRKLSEIEETLNNYEKDCPFDVFFAMSHGVHRGKLKSGKGDNREIFINKLIKKNKDIIFDVFGMNKVQLHI